MTTVLLSDLPAEVDFEPQDKILCWQDDKGEEHFAPLFTPSERALQWDGAPEGVNAAFGSRHSCFLYIKLEVTGRKPTTVFDRSPRVWPKGLRAQITFTSVSFDDGVQFSDQQTAWVVDKVL